ncbi:MAG: hypothetical protein H7Y00_00790 [Fimbriimonadaceae bacterium]|nr:hypothetical protein [Chitinophagales bacterium]
MNSTIPAVRQLACIMFTDIVGYTALMGEDEQKAFSVLKRNREIQRPIIEKFGGTWIKELGDGILATFPSVTDSVLASAAIQIASYRETNFHLRIGLHLSEVIFENGDVFGDGVNIASRIQSLADVGGILISETVQKNLTNKRGIETKLLGDEKLKNVKEAITLYKVIITDDYIAEPIPETKKETPGLIGKSIAVMPFVNLSKDEEQEYFSEGIAEEIIVTLSGIKNLKVVGRRSSFQFKGGTTPVSEIGKILNVSTILEGSVRRHGKGLRIYAELINIEDGCQLWAEKYDREITDMYDIQDDIASNIAEKLKVTFHEQESRQMPVNMEAYELLLKGRFYVEKYVEGFEKALACFTRAIEIDPGYGEAYTELAKLHFLFTMNLFFTPREGFERAKFYAEKALSLNSELGGAHYVLGQINFWYYWDMEKAKKEYELAEHSKVSFYFTGVVLDPWYHAFGYGDYDAALKSIYKILETDPLSFFAMLHLGYFYTFGKMPNEAREVLNKILAAVPGFSEAERLIAYNYFFENDIENALLHARKAAAMSQGIGWAQNTLIIALARHGDHAEARELLAAYESQKGPLCISPIGIALVHTYLGDFDTAFQYLEKAIDYHDIWIMSLKYNPEYDLLRKDERFEKILQKVGFTD